MPEYLPNGEKTWPTKAMFGVLVFFGLATLILGTLSLGKGIDLAQNRGENSSTSQTLGEEEAGKTIEELQAMDTDGDGLSDFNELYVYGTSPYLKDSDSDTFGDKEEIDGGFDPNCPKGQDCRGTINTNTQAPLTNTSKTQVDNTDLLPVDMGAVDTTQRALTPEEKEQLKQLTPAQMRELLLSTGDVTQEQLDAISDDELMAVVEGVLAE